MPRAPLSLLCLLLVMLLPPQARADDDADLMKACPGLAAWAATHPHHDDEADERDAGRTLADPALRAELDRRASLDQDARNALIADEGKDPTLSDRLMAVDADNLAWLKDVVKRHGFPTVPAVGEQGVSNAWLLAQHADRDPAFQTTVLELLQPRLADGSVRKSDVAMLTDRVLRAQGKPQRYGTQFDSADDGSLVQGVTEDPEHVEQRRAAMDLMPLPTYRCVLQASYGVPVKPTPPPRRP